MTKTDGCLQLTVFHSQHNGKVVKKKSANPVKSSPANSSVPDRRRSADQSNAPIQSSHRNDLSILTGQPFLYQNAWEFEFFPVLLNSMNPPVPGNELEARHWLPEALRMSHDGGAVQMALKTLTTTRAGRLKQSSQLAYQGRAFYAQTLALLQQDLQSHNKAFTVQTVLASRLLALYEVGQRTRDQKVLPAINSLRQLFDSSIVKGGGW